MTAKKSLLILASLTAIGILSLAGFNYFINPLCYYRCGDVTLTQKTVNSYYQTAQRILQNPDAQLIVLGSSRGETMPMAYIAQESGLKSLNLSVGGAEFYSKIAFLNLARQHLKLRQVIWLADYFELMDETAGDKIRFTPALRQYATGLRGITWREALKKTTLLFDHNTLEASAAWLRKRKTLPPKPGYENDQMDEKICTGQMQNSRLTPAKLKKEIGIIYDGYAHKILQPLQSETSFKLLAESAKELAREKIDLIIVVPGYHKDFILRLNAEFPEILNRHRVWLTRLKTLEQPRIQILDYFQDIPGDDRSPAFWTDGVHFTCRGAIAMLRNHI